MSFVIWRMKELNLLDKEYTADNIIEKLPEYIKSEPYTVSLLFS